MFIFLPTPDLEKQFSIFCPPRPLKKMFIFLPTPDLEKKLFFKVPGGQKNEHFLTRRAKKFFPRSGVGAPEKNVHFFAHTGP
jgi:hypothetical protein